MKTNFKLDFVARIWELAGGVNIRTKIMGIVLGGTLLLSLGITFQVRHSLAQIMENELHARGISIGRDLAARSTDLILIHDFFGLNQLLLDTQKNNPDVRYAFILNPDGEVLAHTFGSGFPAGLIELNHVEPEGYQNTISVQTPEGTLWDVAVPVFNGKAGTARVGISNNSVQRVLLDLTSHVLLTTGVVLGLSLLAAIFLTFILTRPILELVEAARAIGQGEFSRRVRRWANDEIGDLAETFNQMAGELERADLVRYERELLRRQLLESVITAQEEERRRIARELHDSTSQSLTSLKVNLSTLEMVCECLANAPEYAFMCKELEKTLEEVHSLAVQLRPAALDDLGLAAALDRYLQEWQIQNKIAADFIVHIGDRRLPEMVETTVYRIVQEGLTNVVRHAEAKSVSVLVERRNNEVITVIEDDGKGFIHSDVKTSVQLGLLGVQERIELLGGKLTIETSPGMGTSLFIKIPIEPHEMEPI